jgi:hypothetical protein
VEKDYTIESDIIVKNDGTLFLIGGNHSVLKYVQRMISPTDQSVANFSSNVSSRLEFCQSIGAVYKHVLFPDKQSIMIEEFPVKDIRCLGEYYFEKQPQPFANVVYPTDILRKEPKEIFLPLDTHMSDYGSAVVLEEILKAVGMFDAQTMKELYASINLEVNINGDLGIRFNPPLTQKAIKLRPPWKYFHVISGNQLNDGLVDILINPKAAMDKTIVLFGDSFFRVMLKHFAWMFSKVVCFRSRFFHPEMVQLIKPAVVLTGNVERYLSNVETDREGFPFFYYNYMRPEGTPTDQKFLDAYMAVLTPQAERSKAYFQQKYSELESVP